MHCTDVLHWHLYLYVKECTKARKPFPKSGAQTCCIICPVHRLQLAQVAPSKQLVMESALIWLSKRPTPFFFLDANIVVSMLSWFVSAVLWGKASCLVLSSSGWRTDELIPWWGICHLSVQIKLARIATPLRVFITTTQWIFTTLNSCFWWSVNGMRYYVMEVLVSWMNLDNMKMKLAKLRYSQRAARSYLWCNNAST